MGFNNASSKRERMGSSPSERCMAREWSWSVGDVITCLIVGKKTFSKQEKQQEKERRAQLSLETHADGQARWPEGSGQQVHH